MWIRACRGSLALAVSAALAALLALPASGQAAGPPSAWQRVADAYAPIVMVRKQEDPPCDTDAEQYEPTSVSTVLGNPSVLLERDVPAKKRPVFVRAGPTAADIAGLGFEYYLNLPGDPLGDTCVYARDFQKLKKEGRAPTIVYAHIADQNGHPGFALQYWFFWYFNQFNDLHEADWEGMQLNFDDADTPEAALSEGPSEMVLFQHAGAERAGWDDAKVEKDGRHPIVYPAAGSHATFYSSGVYVGNGGHGSGVGCDYTSKPLRELRPRVILMPDDATRKGPFAWLSYYGKWGQKAAGFNNGVDGPQTKPQWFDPFRWTDDQRESSVRLPGGTLVGPQVAAAFCGAVAAVSDVLNAQQKASTKTFVLLVVIIVLLIVFLGFTRWRPVDLEHLPARRSFGQLVRAARQLYGRHWTAMVLLALVAIPIVGGMEYLVRLVGPGVIGDLFDTFSRPVAAAIVVGAVAMYIRLLVETGEASFVGAWRRLLRRFWPVVLGQLWVTFLLVLMGLTIIGIPFAVWKLVGWGFVPQEILFADKPVRGSLRGSSDIVRGRWWHAARAVVFFNLLIAVAGPILTFALIFTPLPLTLINLIGSLVFALLIPYFALGITLLYFDLQTRATEEPAKPRRSFKIWRPRQFGRRVIPQPAQPAPAAGE